MKMTNIISIFIASSIEEFMDERIYIGAFVRQLNDSLIDRSIQVRLYMCEDELENCQAIYNRYIDMSSIFIALVGKKLGSYTREEIELASGIDTIKKKYLVLVNECQTCVPDGLLSHFSSVYVDHKHLKNEVYNIIKDAIEDRQCYHEVESVSSITVKGDFSIMLPKLQIIENAIISNNIRRLRDQEIGIVVREDFSPFCNAYIGLISDEYESEVARLKEIVGHGIDGALFLLFVNARKIGPIQELVTSLESSLGHYADYYDTNKKLELISYNKLYHALVQQNCFEGFIYIVEDDWLIRKGVWTKRKYHFINFLNCFKDRDYTYDEQRKRKERIIVNLLNTYLDTGQYDRHKEALSYLYDGKIEVFEYESVDDIEEMRINRKEQDIAKIDFLDRELEALQCRYLKVEVSEDIVRNKIKEFDEILKDVKQKYVTVERLFRCYYRIANFLVANKSDFRGAATTYYRRALEKYCEIQVPLKDVKEMAKQSMLALCEALIEYNDFAELKRLFEKDIIEDDTDIWYTVAILIDKFVVYRATGDSLAEIYRKRIDEVFESENYNVDNGMLSLYIDYELIKIWPQLNYIDDKMNAIIEKCSRLYSKYMSDVYYYDTIGIRLEALQAFLNDDVIKYNRVVERYDRNVNDQVYLNLRFLYQILLKRKGEIGEALTLVKDLASLYKGSWDIAICHQNAALLYMLSHELTNAETEYKEAEQIFRKAEAKAELGNICDGLSYCYILQKKFVEAEEASIEAIGIVDYRALNKYCNYISSLLCQKKDDEARCVLSQLSNDEYDSVKSILIDDWKEMQGCGIETSQFKSVFCIGPGYTAHNV